LTDLGKRSHVIAEYAESLQKIGDIGPRSTASILKNFEEFNFQNQAHLVLLVIHYVHKELEWQAEDKLNINDEE